MAQDVAFVAAFFKIIAWVEDPVVIEKILAHLSYPSNWRFLKLEVFIYIAAL